MKSLLNLSAAILSAVLLNAPAQAETESPKQLAEIVSLRLCNDSSPKYELSKDGVLTLNFLQKAAARDDFCQTLIKIKIPAGYSLKPGLEAQLTVAAELFKADDSLGLSFKAQSGEKVSKLSKSVALSSEGGSLSRVTLSADLALPEIGFCTRDPKDQEYNLSFATAARISRSEGSTATGSLVSLVVPALALQLIDCSK